MDEEDMREAEESRKFSMAEEYAGFGSTVENPEQRDALMDILRPSGETVGVKLMKKMGWKEGQGVGPKVKREAHLDGAEVGHDAAHSTHLFAPEDPPMISLSRKFDHKGLGLEDDSCLGSDSIRYSTSVPPRHSDYNSDDGNQSVATSSRNVRKGTRAPEAKRGAFGVGILNDTGSDDEDPYQMGPKISYNRVIGGDKRPQKKRDAAQTASNPLLRTRPIFTSKKLKGKPGSQRCHDGRLPLDGFVLSTELDSFALMNLQDEKYKPPQVPQGWVSKKQPSKEHSKEAYMSSAEAAKLSTMDAKTRAALLGEEQMPGKSIFDFLTPAARDRIVAASGKSNLPSALSEKPAKALEAVSEDGSRVLQDLVPKLEAEVAMQALNRGLGGWMPYAEDREKRARYRAFLEIRAGIRDGLPERILEMSRDDWVNEMHEFARAAQVFKPVTGMMASRFTSSSSHPQPASDETHLTGNGEKPEDPAVNAAKMGMFGPLTRSVKSFYPIRLLCKRFNVEPLAHVQVDPDNGLGPGVGPGSMANTRLQTADNHMLSNTELGDAESRVIDKKMLQSSGAVALESSTDMSGSAPTRTVDPERNDALEAERPGDEVFKAIFGSDDEDG